MEREKSMGQEMKEHRIVEQVPWSETCFGCNGGPNEGIGMRAFITEDGYVVGRCRVKAGHQGFPDTVHDGIIATYFDEVLWHATRVDDPDLLAMTVEMTTRYQKRIPVGEELRVVARPAVFDGRHVRVEGYILLSDDTVAATASVHYITVRQEHVFNKTENARVKYQGDARELGSIRF